MFCVLKPGERELALRRRQDAAEDREQRRLAGAGRAHQQGQLAGMQLQVDALQHLDLVRCRAEHLHDAFGLEDDFAVALARTLSVSRIPLAAEHDGRIDPDHFDDGADRGEYAHSDRDRE